MRCWEEIEWRLRVNYSISGKDSILGWSYGKGAERNGQIGEVSELS